MPKDVGFVLLDSNGKFIASAALRPSGQNYMAILSEGFVQHSYFVVPYIANSDGRVYQVFLRDQQ